MNKQIKKIVEQTYVDVITTKGMTVVEDGCYIVSPDRLEKYTHAVVKECMNVALDRKKWVDNQAVFDPRDQAWNKARVQQSQHIVDKIKEHFGVKE